MKLFAIYQMNYIIEEQGNMQWIGVTIARDSHWPKYVICCKSFDWSDISVAQGCKQNACH